MRRRVEVLALAVALAGCATHPLGGDWEQLDAAGREARAVEALRDLMAGGVDGAGAPFQDRKLVRCDRRGVRYVPLRGDGEGQESGFAWADVVGVEAISQDTVPSRPETLLVSLREQPEPGQVADLVVPALASVGLGRPYVQLRSRPTWSRNRMVHALRYLGDLRAASPAKPRPAAKAAPARPAPAEADAPREDPAAVEAKLRRLKTWREQGLIDEAEYQRKRTELLDRL